MYTHIFTARFVDVLHKHNYVFKLLDVDLNGWVPYNYIRKKHVGFNSSTLCKTFYHVNDLITINCYYNGEGR